MIGPINTICIWDKNFYKRCINDTMDRDAWQLLRRRPDMQWSWVDCASFVVMEQREIREALTTDHHFEQAGLIRLLKA